MKTFKKIPQIEVSQEQIDAYLGIVTLVNSYNKVIFKGTQDQLLEFITNGAKK
jgi:hypothetical protein|tara:strand:- start:320 stop:478 length:159 start_codon:yes stop_codon:yes gene_type:complete